MFRVHDAIITCLPAENTGFVHDLMIRHRPLATPPPWGLFLVLCCGITPPGMALGDADPLESFLIGNPSLSTSSRIPLPASLAPATVYTLDREQIERLAARNIPELLESIPGLDVARTSQTQYEIGIRGSNQLMSNRVMVMVDGRPILEEAHGLVFWQAWLPPLAAIDRIEVVLGPSSSLYGANAATGVIQLFTRHNFAPLTLFARRDGTLNGQEQGLTSGIRQGGLNLSAWYDKATQERIRSGPHWIEDVAHSNAQIQATGIPGLYPAPPRTQGLLAERYAVNAHLQMGGENAISFQGGGSRGVDQFMPQMNIGALPWHTDQHWWRASFEGGSGALSAQRVWDREQVMGLPPDYDLAMDNLIVDGHLHQQWGPHNALLGGSLRDIRYEQGGRAGSPGVTSHDRRLSIFAEWSLADLNNDWYLGLRGDEQRLDADGDRRRFVSPRFSWRHRLSPHHSLLVTAGQSYRLATLWEQGLDMIMNPLYLFGGNADRPGDGVIRPNKGVVAPEQVRGIELSYQGEGGRWQGQAALWGYEIHNRIAFRYEGLTSNGYISNILALIYGLPVGGTYGNFEPTPVPILAWSNTGVARFIGGEGRWSYQPDGSWRIDGWGTAIRRSNRGDGEPLSLSPDLSGGASLHYLPLPQVDLGIALHTMGPRRFQAFDMGGIAQGQTLTNLRVAGWSRLDLSGRYKMGALNIKAVVRNLANRQIRSIPTPQVVAPAAPMGAIAAGSYRVDLPGGDPFGRTAWLDLAYSF
ncbi:MAG: hypothetical protein AUJ55_07545 [Proteobacteria bacterium CG1_02_64_396]|nr:MAG: hypothetical protein AUJ55_07545 [Proteobacteria bacterium CG1_02_64_396]